MTVATASGELKAVLRLGIHAGVAARLRRFSGSVPVLRARAG